MYRKLSCYALASCLLLLTACNQNKPQVDQKTPDVQEQSTVSSAFDFNSFRDAYYNHCLDSYDFKHIANSTNNLDTRESTGDLWYSYYIDFTHDDNDFNIQASYTVNDWLSAVYITKESNGAIAILYDEGTYKNDLDELMSYEESVDDWYKIELPEKYSIGEFQANLGINGGALISPEVNPSVEWAPIDEWSYAGFIGKIEANNPEVGFEFKDGIPEAVGLPSGNHFEKEILNISPMDKNEDWYMMAASSKNELYTFAQLEELEASGKTLSDDEMFSLYWEFYFLKEGNDNYYYLSLSQKEFSYEDAENIAKSVEIVDKKQ